MEQQNNKVNYVRRKAVPAQYRRKRSLPKILLFFGGAVLLCVLLMVFLKLEQQEPAPNVSGPAAENTVIHLVAGGNVNITDKTVASGLSADGYDYTEVFRDVLPVLASGDVTMLNFEGIVNGTAYGSETRSAPTQLLTALKNAGVDVLQTANSYSVFGGLRGLNSTLQSIRGAGMTPLGTYADKADFTQSGGYIIWDIKGVKVAMMAFTKGMVEGMGLPEEDCVNLLYEDYKSTYQKVDTEGIQRIVRNAAAHGPDVMVALVHWGSEQSDQVSKSQQKICTILQEEGVDAIIGTHPQYLQKVEFDSNKGTFVAWSLGDFYGDGEIAGTNYSVLLNLEITKNGETGEAKITGFTYVPTFLETGEDGTVRVLRMEEAIAGYENRHLDCVSEETYNAMKSAMQRITARLG